MAMHDATTPPAVAGAAPMIALLRGVNVGGHKVPMAELRELVAGLGHGDVRTYVQSGNVVFTAADRPRAEIARELEQALEARFGFAVPVVLRSRDALADLVAAEPLGHLANDPAKRFVVFLDADVDPARLVDFDPDAFAPESFLLREREVVLWCPGGIGRSPLALAITGRRLAGRATARNWRTVERLLALANGDV
jgi:uncharacterized protein (DUF1697 family)